MQNGEEGCWWNGQKWPKILGLTRIRTRGLPGSIKSEKFLSTALPLSHGGLIGMKHDLNLTIKMYKVIFSDKTNHLT